LKAFDYMGPHRYSIRFCTFERTPRFAEPDVVDLTLKQFLRAAAEERFEILAYCFMPDHVHLLIQGASEDSDCKRFIFRAKQYSGFYYSRQYEKQQLWQRYCCERVLRNDEATLVVARYIVANPVRAGLVSQPEDYPFVGSCVVTLRELLEAVAEAT